MQELIILGGPNGAGKSTFANEYLPAAAEGLVFVNADEIAKDLMPLKLPGAQLDVIPPRESFDFYCQPIMSSSGLSRGSITTDVAARLSTA